MPAKRIEREHILQRHLREFVRDAVLDGEFFAFDRSKPAGRFTHLRERARGVRKGTPDTLLCLADRMPIWCELKAPGEEPSGAQNDVGADLQRLGHVWFWTTTVTAYHAELVRLSVPMRANAALLAAHHDACVEGVIATAERKRGAVPKAPRRSRAPAKKPSASYIRRMEGIRSKFPF
jgi:hypothetical protein